MPVFYVCLTGCTIHDLNVNAVIVLVKVTGGVYLVPRVKCALYLAYLVLYKSKRRRASRQGAVSVLRRREIPCFELCIINYLTCDFNCTTLCFHSV